MNAFHPDYIKTYHPEFSNSFKSQQALTAEREMAKRAIRPRRNYVFAQAVQPKRRYVNL